MTEQGPWIERQRLLVESIAVISLQSCHLRKIFRKARLCSNHFCYILANFSLIHILFFHSFTCTLLYEL